MKKDRNYALFIKKKYTGMFFICMVSYGIVYISELVDSVLAGRFISEAAVSAVSLVNPFYMFIVFVGGLISAGTDTLYSRAAGDFNMKKAHKIFGQSFIVTLILSTVLSLGMVIFKEPLLNMYAANNSPEIMALASDYYDYYCYIAFLYPVQWLLYSVVFTDGGVGTSIAADTANMVTNLAVSLISVGSMGIKGLGLGTACGQLAAIIALSTHFLKKSNSIRLGFQFVPREILETVVLGLSSSTSMLMGAIVDLVMNIYIINYVGYKFLPAYSIANLVLNLALVFAHAGTSSNPLTSLYYGERNPDGNKKVMEIASKYLLIEAAIFTIIVEVAGGIIPSMYSITDPEVFSAAVTAVRLIGIGYIPTAMLLLYMMYYSTVGHNGLSMILLTGYMLVFPLGLSLIFGSFMGMTGIFLALMLTPFLAVGVCIAVIFAKYGRGKFPYMLMDTRAKIDSRDILVNQDNAMAVCDWAEDILSNDSDIPARSIPRVRLAIEETYMLISERNQGRKVYSECTLMRQNGNIELLIRDNGVISDITEETAGPQSLRHYVFKQVSGAMFGNSYLMTASYNRYKYEFEAK